MKTAIRSMAMILAATAAMASAAAEQMPRPLALTDVAIDDAFWSPKLKLWRTVTINDCFDKFEKSGALQNFDLILDGKKAGKHFGEPWYDGLVYEMITAGADFLITQPDAELQKRIEGYVDRIVAAGDTQADGFLNTYTQAKEPTRRWGTNGGNDRFQHDVYNAGCLVEAAVHYHRATGDTKLLRTAVRQANLMCDVMGPPPRANIIPGHAMPEYAFLDLYQMFKERPALKDKIGVSVDEKRFLDLATFWIDARGNHAGRDNYGPYNQDHTHVTDQKTIEGHAVRATLLGIGLADLGRDGGRPEFRRVASDWWTNMVTKRAYLTGGIGASAEDEKFGGDYVLPNTGYAETCAAVSKSFFDARILQQSGNAAAADEFERSIYNGALTGVSVAGTSYFYENPLAAGPERNRWDWHTCPCCPPMFLKLMSALPTFIYSADDRGVYVNLFVGSTAKTVVNGNAVSLKQTTGYPWAGDAAIAVTPERAGRFGVNVRVPAWCQPTPPNPLYRSAEPVRADAFTLTVNGRPAAYTVEKGYARIEREWQPGDVVAVKVDVSPRRVLANEAIEADRGRVALMAGPIVYCLESTDQAVPMDRLRLKAAGPLTAEVRPDLLGGVRVIRGPGVDTQQAEKAVDFLAVPFYATANRGPRTMAVWLPAVK